MWLWRFVFVFVISTRIRHFSFTKVSENLHICPAECSQLLKRCENTEHCLIFGLTNGKHTPVITVGWFLRCPQTSGYWSRRAPSCLCNKHCKAAPFQLQLYHLVTFKEKLHCLSLVLFWSWSEIAACRRCWEKPVLICPSTFFQISERNQLRATHLSLRGSLRFLLLLCDDTYRLCSEAFVRVIWNVCKPCKWVITIIVIYLFLLHGLQSNLDGLNWKYQNILKHFKNATSQ